MTDTLHLVFLKLGGSLITDKASPHTAQSEILTRLAAEIHSSLLVDTNLRLVIGHGSGSFGHVPAQKFGTRAGVHTQQEWAGFAEVWREARALNQLVVEALACAGLPVIALPPSAGVIAADGVISRWDLSTLISALDGGLVPVINGDVIFDQARGGTILSTEELFLYLARQVHPVRILLAGVEKGVWADFPACRQLIKEITPGNFIQVSASLGQSTAVDVTGGMLSKVRTMLDLVRETPGLDVLIFSGLVPGLVQSALLGTSQGTRIYQDKT